MKGKASSQRQPPLRRRAEKVLEEGISAAVPELTPDTLLRLHHELEVHEVELELQNEELRQTKDDLETALERFSSLYDFAPVGYLSLDHEGVVRSANLAAGTLLEVPRSQLVNRPFGGLDPSSRPLFASFLQEVFANPGRRVAEFRLKTPQGTELYVRMVAAAAGAEALVALIDLTDLHQLQLFRTQVECVEEYAVYLLDPRGYILNWNAGAERLEGYRPEEIVGRHFSCLFDAKDRREGKPQLELTLAATTGRFAQECWRIRKDGSGFWADVVLTPLRDQAGTLWGFSKMTHDITRRKKAEEALRKSEQKLSRIFESVPVLIAITTLKEGRCVDINRSGMEALGYRCEEVLGRTFAELEIWENPADRERMRQELAVQGKVRDLECRFRRRDGSVFTAMLSAEAVDLGDGKYLLYMVKDITERIRLESNIARLNSELGVRACELEAANRELEAFNYSLAHDLRQPLNNIGSAVQILQRLGAETPGEEFSEYLGLIMRNTQRMDQFIAALLQLSQVGHAELSRTEVDLSVLAQEIVAGLRRGEPQREVEFRCEEGVVAQSDPILLRLVLENLIGNAWKYTRSRDKVRIEFGVREIEGVPTYLVRDNGEGFDMAEAEEIFTPFCRLKGKPGEGGFGIGLATVERVVRRHGGRIWAEAHRGGGACFFFTLG